MPRATNSTVIGWIEGLAPLAAALLLSGVATGCSIKQTAVNSLVEVLGEAQKVYLSDEDPELIAEALPFNLKTIETLLVSSPKNRDLLLIATKSFSLYAYGFVEPRVQELGFTDFEESERVRARAGRLYRRAYRYGLRGLEVEYPGIASRLSQAPEAAAEVLEEEDLPLAVWTAAALGGAVSVAKDDPETTADIAVIGALLSRGLALDETYDRGTIHEFLFAYEAGRVGGSPEKAREHYRRALELGRGKEPSIWLSWAEKVCIPNQDRAQFLELIERTLAYDLEGHPDYRLLNILAQRRARWLKDSVDEYFLESEPS